jgi:hypothetical protein
MGDLKSDGLVNDRRNLSKCCRTLLSRRIQ